MGDFTLELDDGQKPLQGWIHEFAADVIRRRRSPVRRSSWMASAGKPCTAA